METIQQRADHAKQLLNDDLLKEAFSALEAETLKAIKTAKFAGYQNVSEARDILMLHLQVIDSIQKQLHRYVTAGKVEEANELLKG